MKKHIAIRILAALGGVTLWMLGLFALAETFFAVPLTVWAGKVLNAGTPLAVLAALVSALMLCAFGVCCLMMLSSKRAVRRKGFVMQKGENGLIGVSVKSIEGLVFTCVQQHDVIAGAEVSVVEKRDGIIILLNIEGTAGVNIPLAVGALQKQIKEYVSACTGVDVHEVRVMVENTDNGPTASPYAVEAPVAVAIETHQEPITEIAAMEVPQVEAASVAEVAAESAPAKEFLVEEAVQVEAPQAEEIPAVQEPVPVPMPVAAPPIPPMPEIVVEDERPLHQRLFGAEEQPAFVPMPPEMLPQPDEAIAEEAVPEAGEELELPEASADGLDANAVLDVVNAMVNEEEMIPEEDMEAAIPEETEIPADEEDELPKE